MASGSEERSGGGFLRGRAFGTGDSEPPAGGDERVLQVLDEVTGELMQVETKQAAADATVATASEVLDLPLAGVWLYDEAANALVPAAYPDHEALPDEQPTFEPGDSLAWEVFETGEPSVYEDLWEVEGRHNDDTAIRAEVIAPLGEHGVLLAGSTTPGAFGADFTHRLGILETAVTSAFERIERENAMRTLQDATREMVIAESKEDVVELALDAAVEVLGLTQTGVHFHDDSEEALVPVDWSNSLEEELGEPPALGPDSLAWEAYEDGDVIAVDDFWDAAGAHNPDTPFRSEMIVPLGEHGVALFSSTDADAFDDTDRRFAEVLCSNATPALDRLGREAELRRREQELEHKNSLYGRLTDQVEDSVEQLATTAEDVSGSSQQISAVADEQADAMAEVSGGISEVSAVVEEIASLSEEVRATSESARDLAEDGRESADDTAAVMEDIESATAAATDEFGDLHDEIEAIDEIVEVIDSVADRTNLLALNASIEAANAGEAGNGFAVVAEEVKKLAEETQEQAGRIEALVDGIQANTEETVQRLQRATDQVQAGLDQVERTRRSFDDIESAVTETAFGIEEVADATDDQAERSEEIAGMVEEAEELADTVSAEIQSVAAANQQQAEMVEELRDSVEHAYRQLQQIEQMSK